MIYVIWNTDNRKFVAPPGLPHSYTNKLQHAQTFRTRDEAERHRCSNEVVWTLEEAMGR